MGTTTHRGYPYPEPTDRVRNGSSVFRAFAEALDEDLAWHPAAVFPRAESSASAGATATVAWGPSAVLDNFTYNGAGTLTFVGLSRLFIVDVEVEVESGGGIGVSSVVEVRLNGNTFAGSYDQIALDDAGTPDSITIGSRRTVHRVTSPLLIQTGETIDVTAAASPSGTLGYVGLRVYPIGPA